MINEYHTDISNTSKFMEELLKKQQQYLKVYEGAVEEAAKVKV